MRQIYSDKQTEDKCGHPPVYVRAFTVQPAQQKVVVVLRHQDVGDAATKLKTRTKQTTCR